MDDKLATGNRVVFRTGQAVDMVGSLVRFTRFLVVFELYNPMAELRLSEVLEDFEILVGKQALYSGKAVVRNLIDTGPAALVCEATVSEGDWAVLDSTAADFRPQKVREAYRTFVAEWQKLYRVRTKYKLVVADMQMYFTDLQLWLNQLELGGRRGPVGDGLTNERELAGELADAVMPTLSALFEQFEESSEEIEEDLIPAHQVYAKRQLHPLLLCAPFFNRCYVKPLGYAGDYEMINMMMRDPCEGGTLFAKVMNHWFLSQPPVRAHRNRIDQLTDYLIRAAMRAAQQGRTARIMSLGCGPAHEVQRFLAGHPFPTEFTLLDFNEETIQHAQSVLDALKEKHSPKTQFQFVKKSVHHLLKESSKAAETPRDSKYDLIYCAGLFDYLSNPVCKRLMELAYDWTRGGGSVVATNVHTGNPSIGWMELMVDWHLIYRNSQQMAELIPQESSPDDARVVVEATGVNVFLEVSKPENG